MGAPFIGLVIWVTASAGPSAPFAGSRLWRPFTFPTAYIPLVMPVGMPTDTVSTTAHTATFSGMSREESTDYHIDTIAEPSVFKAYATNLDGGSKAQFRTYTLLLEPGVTIVRQKFGLIQVRKRISLEGSRPAKDKRLGNTASRVSLWPNTTWYGHKGFEIKGDDETIHWLYNEAPETDWDLGPRSEMTDTHRSQRQLDLSDRLAVRGKWRRKSDGCSFDPVLRSDKEVRKAELGNPAIEGTDDQDEAQAGVGIEQE